MKRIIIFYPKAQQFFAVLLFTLLAVSCSNRVDKSASRDVNQWLYNYSKLDKNMAPYEVISLLGKPHNTTSSSNGNTGGGRLTLMYGMNEDWSGYMSKNGKTLNVHFWKDKIYEATITVIEDNHRSTKPLIKNLSVIKGDKDFFEGSI